MYIVYLIVALIRYTTVRLKKSGSPVNISVRLEMLKLCNSWKSASMSVRIECNLCFIVTFYKFAR